ncbi:1,4-dihydroxy-2-naphthoate octaprenyltransferase [Neochlamydia sp. TUME1]|uniref:1,4-dihydroxy-2-naphthoate octaprenyltransferase n=1 Tax=Neochlamydia sp. TUME1 TaxID=1478174 RepID=UPI00057DC999|nr:1,4-dihydroxy-2-naphthoate octaprenyltransferase [Neochlamydia sp. TUME1]KIC76271.1 1,4-dihydroxy-2-naphthoate octaprenyltransferase [Neochlamydia sp. TUME1]
MMNGNFLKKPAKWQAFTWAARPKTLILVVVPIFVGTLLALNYTSYFKGIAFASALLAGLFIQVAVNLINDALDFKKGADNAARLGPERATQKGWLSFHEVLYGGYFCLALAFILGMPMIMQGGILFLILLIVASLLAYGYTGGPFPLAYYGLGEFFVILFFGIIGTQAGFYLQAGKASEKAFLAGLQIGLLAAAVNAINNLRDIESDEKAKKITIAVKFGKTFARLEITLLILLPYFLSLLWSDLGFYKAGLLPFVTLPLGFTLIRCIWFYEPSKIYNTFLGVAALLNLLFGACLSLGFWLQ